MAKCRFCGNHGLFLSVNKYGLCEKCASFVNLDISNRCRILTDSINIIQSTKNADTFLGRIDDAKSSLSKLIEYENMGIVITDKKPSESLSIINNGLDDEIKDCCNRIFIDTQTKAAELKTAKGKISAWEKYRTSLKKLNDSFPGNPSISHYSEFADKFIKLVNNASE